jgi:hypothetical protein
MGRLELSAVREASPSACIHTLIEQEPPWLLRHAWPLAIAAAVFLAFFFSWLAELN